MDFLNWLKKIEFVIEKYNNNYRIIKLIKKKLHNINSIIKNIAGYYAGSYDKAFRNELALNIEVSYNILG